jgi:hypothetical protein
MTHALTPIPCIRGHTLEHINRFRNDTKPMAQILRQQSRSRWSLETHTSERHISNRGCTRYIAPCMHLALRCSSNQSASKLVIGTGLCVCVCDAGLFREWIARSKYLTLTVGGKSLCSVFLLPFPITPPFYVACVQFADGALAICSFYAALLEGDAECERNPTGRVPASPIVHCARASLPIICTGVIWAANARMPRVARSDAA